MTRLAAQVTKQLANGHVRAIHQHRAHRRAHCPDGFQQAHTRFAVNARVDHHEVEILESTLTDRTCRIHRRAHVDAFLFSEVGHHRDVTGVEIDDEQSDWRIHRGPQIARNPPEVALHSIALDAFLLTRRARNAGPGSSSTGRAEMET